MTHITDFTTPDLSDDHPGVQVLPYQFRRFGLRERFAGPVSTVACFEDNSRVAEAVKEPGEGRVLLVDGQGSLERSLVGDNMAAEAIANGWAGVVVIGAIRDVEILDTMDIGVHSLGVIPVRTDKQGRGDRDVILSLKEVVVHPGYWLYADRNGIVISETPVHSGANQT